MSHDDADHPRQAEPSVADAGADDAGVDTGADDPTPAALGPLGWDDGWAAALAEADAGAEPGRVLRHHGAGLVLALADGPRTLMLTRRLDPEPTVGDWVAVSEGEVVTVLPRRSLLRRRAAHGDGEQQLAANVDRVLLVCGLDRPVKDGRIQRGTAIAHDAGAEPVVVLTKAERPDSADAIEAAAEVRAGNPGVAVFITSVKEGKGLDELQALIRGRTVTLLGESGAGKSSIVNALLGTEVVLTGEVRDGDAKGRHTTTGRELHLLADDGVLIDTPGIREVGLVGEAEAVAETFAEVSELAETCRFSDCHHDTEPGCAVVAAVEAGQLDPVRVERWKALRDETEAAQLRAQPHEKRRHDKRFARVVKDAQKRKGRPDPDR
jgi:ribosome biogenesis GTPase